MDSQRNAFLSEDELLNILNSVRPFYKRPSDHVFTDVNKLWKQFTKKGVITIDEDDLHIKETISCNVPSCNQSFDTVFTYQTHYNALHRYHCSQCKKSLPSPHLLDLHLLEQHDSFFATQSERKPMYSCFLSECEHKSSNPEERRDHCISVHKFPHNFRFDKPAPTKKDISFAVCNIEEKLKDCSTSEIEKKDSYKNFSFGSKQVKMFKHKRPAKNHQKHEDLHDQEMKISPLEAKSD